MATRRRRAPGLIVLAGAAFALVLPAPAPAAFPGTNGRLAFGWYDRREDELGLTPSRLKRSIDVARPGGHGRRSLRACTQVDGRPDSGDCSIDYLSPAWSPDGKRLAFDAGTRLGLMRSDGTRLPPARSAHGRRRRARLVARRQAACVQRDRGGRRRDRPLRPRPCGRRREAADHRRRTVAGMVLARPDRLHQRRLQGTAGLRCRIRGAPRWPRPSADRPARYGSQLVAEREQARPRAAPRCAHQPPHRPRRRQRAAPARHPRRGQPGRAELVAGR